MKKRTLVSIIVASMVCLPFWAAAQDGADLTPQQENGKWGYVNSARKKVVAFKYEEARAFSEGLAAVKLKGMWGYINKTGKAVIPLTYDWAQAFSGGVAIVRASNSQQFVLIDRTGKKVSAPIGDTGLYWKLNGDTLTITGEGKMPDYNRTVKRPPWTSCWWIDAVDIQTTGPTTIGESAFASCSELTSVHLSDGITTIGGEAFANCKNLASVHLPDGVTTIGIGGFKSCSSLTTMHLPDGVTTIEDWVFSGCENLAAIHLPDGVTTIGAGAFMSCKNLASVHLPDGVTTIERMACWGCTSLTAVQIPASVTTIGRFAFAECSNLNEITVHWTDPSAVNFGEDVFKELTSSNITLHVPEETAAKYQSHAVWGSFRITEDAKKTRE